MNLLTVSGVNKETGGNVILKDISFTQTKNQKIGIAGASGSGKTTLLKIISGLAQRSSGEVLLNNKKVWGPEEKLIPGHSSIGYISQHFELRNNYRVEEELSYTNQLPDAEAAAIYEVCRITHLLKRKTDQLSGGEKQRIVTARMLISSPELLLLDEPFSNLDIPHRQLMRDVINDIAERLKITCILVSHDPADVLSWADKVIVIKEGQIIQNDSPYNIYTQPADEYTAGLFGDYNLIPPQKNKSFYELAGQEIKPGKKLLIRPEDFTIATEEETALKGIVKAIHYFGSYYMITVLLAGTTIAIKTQECNVAKGNSISLFLAPDKAWYV
ncbi:MAG: Fe(3+)-transporting ATPase [Chitinophagaceae bacterium]|nr:Fe(3+)-transporting ATPase [Chitinophagaceae bacterium]